MSRWFGDPVIVEYIPDRGMIKDDAGNQPVPFRHTQPCRSLVFRVPGFAEWAELGVEILQ